jgi:autotransporter-associated beta strand protein
MFLRLLLALALAGAGQSALAQGTGLTGQYYDTATFGTLRTTRVDAEVDFNWGTAIPAGTTVTNADTFSVAWSGQIEPEFSELYTFYVTADDGARLWIDDQLVTLRTFAQAGTGEMRGQVRLGAGQRVNVRLEYLEQTGSASVRLEWSAASRAREVIPTARLHPARVDKAGGSLLKEHWSSIAGPSISSITSHANYPAKPSGREYLTSFECLAQDWADSYGTRVTGYLVPAVTGSYTFAVSGNDAVQLFLSTDASAANKTLIASTTTATAFRAWATPSAPRALVQGQRYYVELLHKEDTGADHWSVGWMKPGDAAFSVVPGSALLQPGITTAQPAQASLLNTLAQEHPRIFSTAERFAWLKAQYLSATASKPKTWAQNAINSANTVLTLPVNTYTPDVRGTILSQSRSVKDRMYQLGTAWWLTGDAQYAERAWTELEAAAAFPDWHPAHFLDTAEMSHAFAIGYDWFYAYWSTTRRTTIRTALINKGLNVGLSQYTNGAWWAQTTANNWNLVCNGGLSLGALAVGTESEALAEDILHRAINSARPVLAHFTTDNGNWYEGPGYWGYTMEYAMRMMAGLEWVLGSDFGLSATRNFADSGWAAIHSAGPSNVIFNYADASAAGARRGPEFFWLARRFGVPVFSWWENQGSGSVLSALWWADSAASLAGTSALPDMGFHGEATTTFKPQEMVTLRGKWNDTRATFVACKGGEMGAQHGNLDAGTFVLDALGKRWFHDLGGDNYALANYFSDTPNPSGTDRWDYYRMRAEGQNTLCINPGAANDMVLDQVAALIAYQSEPSGSGSFAIHDLTPVYSSMTRVWRGVRLLGARDEVLVQDEIVAGTGKTVWWFAHFTYPTTTVAIDPDGTSATMTQGAERLWCKILSGGGTFQIMDAVPLPTSPNPAGQNANTGHKKLAISFTGVTNKTLAVWFVPLAAGEVPPVTPPAIVPLNTWNIAAVSDPPNAANGNGTLNGENAVDIDLRNFVTDDTTPASQMRFAVSGAVNGTVVLLADGHTARFTPTPGYSGVPTFQFTATDTTPDARAVLTYDFELPDPSDPSDLSDASGQGRTGTLDAVGTGAAALVSDVPAALGRAGRSLDLAENGGANGARLSRVLATSDVNFNTSDWTIAGWFKRRDTGSDDTIFHLSTGDGYGAAEELYLIARNASGLELHHYPGPDVSLPTTAAPGAWHHFAVVRSGSTMRLYLNGTLVGTDTSFALAIDQAVPLIFGGHTSIDPLFVPRWFDGQLDELAVFKDDLSAGEVATLASGMTARHFGGLSATGTITLSVAPATYTWTNATNGAQTWSTNANWSGNTAPASSRGTAVQFFTGQTITGSTVAAHNNLAAGFQINTLALGGTSTAATKVTIAGNSIALLNNGAVNPTVALTASNSTITYDVTTPITLGADTTFTATNSGRFIFSGDLSGPGGITRTSSASTLILTGTNTYTGDTVVSAGTVQIGDDGATGTLGAGDVTVDGTLRFDRTGTLTVPNNIGGAGGVVIDCPSGAGTVVFTGNNSFAGIVNVNSGALRITSAAALGEGAKIIKLTNGTSGNPQLRLDGTSADIELPAEFSFQTSNNAAGAIINEAGDNSIAGNISLTGGGGDTAIVVAAGALTLSGDIAPVTTSRNLRLRGAGTGVITGAISDYAPGTALVSIAKSEAGTWSLNGPVNHTGSISVTAGTLYVNGSVIAASSAACSVGATFGGAGTLSCLAVISGNHAPGAATAGPQVFASSVSYGSASHLQWELVTNSAAANDFDQVSAAMVSVTNGARLDLFLNRPGSTVSFTDAFWSASRSWPAVLATTMTGSFQLGTTTADSTGRSASGWGTFSLQQSATGANVVWTAASAWQQWQAFQFGTNWNNAVIAGPTADPDRDGVTNEAERIFGTDPNARPANTLLVVEKTAPAQVTLTFTAVAASGPGFTGLTRRYTLETTTDLANAASWQPVPGHQAIAGADQLVTTTQPLDTPRRCYRLKAWLE